MKKALLSLVNVFLVCLSILANPVDIKPMVELDQKPINSTANLPATAWQMQPAQHIVPYNDPTYIGTNNRDLYNTNTNCATITTFPFSEHFEQGFPDCWSIIDNDGDGYNWYLYEYTTNGHAMRSHSWVNGTVGSVTPGNWLITPRMHITGKAKLTFFVKGTHDTDCLENYGVYISTSGTNTANFNSIFESTTTNSWHQISIPLNNYSGKDIYIAFVHHHTTGELSMLLDDVVVTLEPEIYASPNKINFGYNAVNDECIKTINITSRYLTSDIQISSGYDKCLVSSDGTNFSITTSLPASGGTLYVKLNTSTSFSFNNYLTCSSYVGTQHISLSIPVQGTCTTCSGSITMFPFEENFNNGFPACWRTLDNDDDGYGWERYEFEDNKYAMKSESWVPGNGLQPDNWIITPRMYITGKALLEYKVKSSYNSSNNSSNYTENYSIYISNTGTDLEDFTLLNNYSVTSGMGWYFRDELLNNYNGQNVYIAFRHHNTNNQWGMLLDDVTVTLEPTVIASTNTVIFHNHIFGDDPCIKTIYVRGSELPYNVISASITNSGPFSLSTNGTTFSQSVEMSASGGYLYIKYAPGSVGSHNGNIKLTATDAGDTFVVLEGNCVNCSNPITEFPFSENFNDGLPACWITLDNDNDGYTWEGYSSWVISKSKIGNVGLHPDNWLITPQIHLIGEANLKFKISCMDDELTNEHYGVYISTTGTNPADFTLLYENTTTYYWQNETISLNEYAGQDIYIAFRHYNSYNQSSVLIDKVEIQLLPSIFTTPKALNLGNLLASHNSVQSITVGGNLLTGNITATLSDPANPFSLSTDNTNFSSTVTMPSTGGTLYVKFSPSSEGSYNGQIELSATGVDNKVVQLTGSCINCSNPITTLPYKENFDNGIPDCWTIFDHDDDGYQWFANEGAMESESYHSGPLTPDNWLITPRITISSDATLTFDVKSTRSNWPNEEYGVYVSTTELDTSDFIPIYQGISTYEGTTKEFYLDDYIGENIYIAFRHFNTENEWSMQIDNVEIIGLPTITASPEHVDFGNTIIGEESVKKVTVTGKYLTGDITASIRDESSPFSISTDGTNFSNEVTLPADGGTLYVKHAPSSEGAYDAFISLFTNNTDYGISVIGHGINCDPISEFPYFEDFATNMWDPQLPDCWRTHDNGGDGYNWAAYSAYDNTTSFDCLYSLSNISGNTLTPDNWLISPAINLPQNNMTLTFSIRGGGMFINAGQIYTNCNGKYAVLVSTTGTDIDDFEQIFESTTTCYLTQQSINLNQYAGQTIYIAFRHINTSDQGDLVLDAVKIDYKPTIVANPEIVHFENLTLGTSNTQHIGVHRIPYTGGNITAVTNAPFSISTNNINFSTTVTITYDSNLYVKYTPTSEGIHEDQLTLSMSGADNLIIPLSGSCINCNEPITTFPFIEDFNSLYLPPCWTLFDNDGDGYNWTLYDSAMVSESYSHLDESYNSLTPNNWLVTPKMAIEGTAKLSFDVKSNDYYTESYGIYISTTGLDTNAFMSVFEGTTTFEGETKEVYLNNYDGENIYIAFVHHNTEDEWSMALDNVQVELLPPSIEAAPELCDFGKIRNHETAIQTISVYGCTLMNEITASAEDPFHISTDNTNFSNTVILPATGGTLYVQYHPINAGYNESQITLTSPETNFSIPLSGTSIDCDSPINVFPYYENFDNGLNVCWTFIDGDNDGYNWTLYDNAMVSESYSYIDESANSLTPNNWLITPLINLQRDAKLSFFIKSNDDYYANENYGIYVSTNGLDTTSFTSIYEGTSTYAGDTITIPLNNYNNSDLYIAFVHHNTENEWSILLDDVKIEELPDITVTPESVNFGNIVLGEQTVKEITMTGINLTNDITAAVADTNLPFNISTDNIDFSNQVTLPATGGTLYVKFAPAFADCFDNTIILSSSNTEATVSLGGCGIICEPITEFPYVETFYSNMWDPQLPECWRTRDNDGDGHNWTAFSFSSNVSSTNYLYSSSVYNGNVLAPDNWLISPAFSLPTTNMNLAFSIYGGGAGFTTEQENNSCNEHYAVLVSTTGFNTEDFTEVFQSTTTCTAEQQSIDLSQYAGQTIYIAFRHFNTSAQSSLILDEVKIDYTPTITAISEYDFGSILVGEQSVHEITVTGNNLTEDITASVTGPFSISTDETDFSTETTINTITPLPYNILYVKYSPASVGEHIGQLTLSSSGAETVVVTLTGNGYTCEPITEFPFLEDFNDGHLPNCWTTNDHNNDGTNWEWNSEHEGSMHSAAQTGSVAADNWLISPQLVIEEYSGLMFDIKTNSSAYSNQYVVYVATSGLDPNNLTAIHHGSSNEEWTTQTVSLNEYASQTIQLVFVHENALEIDLDNVRIEQIPFLTADPEFVNFETTIVGEQSVEEITVTGHNLIENITATIDNGDTPFSISADNIDFSNQVTLPATGGTLYVKFAPTFTDCLDNTIVLTSTNTEATVSLGGCGIICDPITEFPYVETFSSTMWNSQLPDCWSAIDNDGDGFNWYWNPMTGDAYTGGGLMTSDGRHPVTYAPLSPDNWLITPRIVLPKYAVLSVDVANLDTSSTGRMKILVSTTGKRVADFDTTIADLSLLQTNTNNITRSITTLERFANKNIYIAFVHSPSDYMSKLFLDNVQIEIEPPVITATPEWLDFENIIVGDQSVQEIVVSGNTFTQDITASVAAPFSISVDGTTFSNDVTLPAPVVNVTLYVKYTPTSEGEHNGQVTLTSHDAETVTVELTGTGIVCDPITELPFVEEFDYGLPNCWRAIDRDGDGHNWEWYADQQYMLSESLSSDDDRLRPDNWIITPQIAIPQIASTDSVQLSFIVHGQSGENYGVFVSTTDPNPDNFTSIYEGTTIEDWEPKKFSLNDFAGQNIYIAIVHHLCEDLDNMAIDDVRIELKPYITVSAEDLNFGHCIVGDQQIKTIDVTGHNLTQDIHATVVNPFSLSTDGTSFDNIAILPAAGGLLYVKYNPVAEVDQGESIIFESEGAEDLSVSIRAVRVHCDGMPIGIPYYENFNNGYPDCWRTVDYDNDLFDWKVNGLGQMTSYGGFTEISYPNNWLISPQLSITQNATLSFSVQSMFQNRHEHYGIYISTEGVDSTDFTQIYEGVTTYEIEEKTFNLNDYVGHDIYIAFVYHNSYRDGKIGIDDVMVTFTPVITAIPEQLSFGPNIIGDEKTKEILVKHQHLTDSLTASVAAPFSISIDGTNFSHEIEIPTYSSLSYDSLTLLVKYTPTTPGGHYGQITLSSPGAEDFLVALSGNGLLCEPVTDLPFYEDFDYGLPNCWRNIDYDGDGVKWHYLGNQAIPEGRMVSTSELADQSNWLITPQVAISENVNLSFFIQNCGLNSFANERYTVYISTDGAHYDNFHLLKEGQTSSDGETITIPLNDYVGQNVYIAFVHHVTDSLNHGLALDDVRIYLQPVITTTPNQLNFGYCLSGDDPVKGINVTGHNTIDLISALANEPLSISTDGTHFDSTATLPASGGTLFVKFTTVENAYPTSPILLKTEGAENVEVNAIGVCMPCDGIINSYPFFEGFDNGFPECWRNIDNDNDGYCWNLFGTNTGAEMVSRSKLSETESLDPDNWLITPHLDLGTNAELSFNVVSFGAHTNENYGVYISTTGHDPEDFSSIFEGTTSQDWETITLDLNDYSNSQVYIAFVHHNSAGHWGMAIDSVKIDLTPIIAAVPERLDFGHCVLGDQFIQKVTVTSINLLDSIKVHSPGGPFTISSDGTNFSLTTQLESYVDTLYVKMEPEESGYYYFNIDLEPPGAEDVNVTAIVSCWPSCDPITEFPYYADFIDGLPNCWRTFDYDGDGHNWEWHNQGEEKAMVSPTSIEDEDGHHALTPDNWMITPQMHLTENEDLSFLVKGDFNNITNANYGVYISTSGQYPEDFTSIFEGTTPSEGWGQQTLSLSDYIGQDIYIAFRHHNDSQSFLMIDDVKIAPHPYITATPEFLNFGNVEIGYYPMKEITVVGHYLTENITITVDEDNLPFSVSSDRINFSNQVTLPADGGTLYVQFAPTQDDCFDNTIVLTSTNAEATVSLGGCGIFCHPITEFPYLEDFNNGFPDCWYTIDNDGDGFDWYWNSMTGDAYTGGGLMTSDGRHPVTYAPLSPDNWLITPRIALPKYAVLSVDVANLDTSSTGRMKILVSTTGKRVADFDTTIADLSLLQTNTNDIIRSITTLERFADENIYIAFVHSPSDYMSKLFLDNVKIEIEQPVITTIQRWLNFGNIIVGDQSVQEIVVNGNTFTQDITASVAAPFSISVDGTTFSNEVILHAPIVNSTLYVKYTPTSGGEHNGQVTLTSHDAETVMVELTGTGIVCDLITELPFVEEFETDLPVCWRNIDNDGDGYYWYSNNGFMTSESSNSEGEALRPDNWLITPQIAIPEIASTDNVQLSFVTFSENGDNYGIFVSTTDPNPESFTSIYEGSATGIWETKTFSLNNYAGQNLYVAFVHHNCEDRYMMSIDDVRIEFKPYITVSDDEVNFGHCIIGDQPVKTINVTGHYLTQDIQAVVDLPFSISTDGTEFDTIATLPASGGMLYVKYSPIYEFDQHEPLTFQSAGAEDLSIFLTATRVHCDGMPLAIPYFESFNNDFPNCWHTFDYDNDGHDWTLSSEGKILSFSRYQNIEGIRPNNWLISPQLSITENAALSFIINSMAQDYPEHYGIYISTGGLDTTDFTQIHEGVTTNQEEEMTFNLNEYVGQDIYIAFVHHNSYNSWAVSLDNVKITLTNSEITEIYVTDCETYTWNDSIYTTSGDYTQNFTNMEGGDSTVVLHLTINQPVNLNPEIVTACEAYNWHGTDYDESGIYTFTRPGINGECDTTKTLQLTINQPVNPEPEVVSACDFFTWHGIAYTESGTYTFIRPGLNNECDTTETLLLTIRQSSMDEFSVDACGSYTWNDSTYTESGVYTQTFENEAGCDSLVYLILTINQPIILDPQVETACESFIWHDSTYTEDGTYTFTRPGIDGECDTTETLELTIIQPSYFEFTTSACESFTWHDSTYTESCDDIDTTINAMGCYNITTLHLTIYQPDNPDPEIVSACESYTWHDSTYTTSGTYTFTRSGGFMECDTIETLLLTINAPITLDPEIVVACESYNWHGTEYDESGNYTFTRPGVDGECDTTETLQLTINAPISLEPEIIAACETYNWHGTEYDESGNYTFTRPGVDGECDTTETLQLTINAPITLEPELIAACDFFTWHGVDYIESGNYTFTRPGVDGECDTTETLQLTIKQSSMYEFSVDACESYTWNDSTYTESGVYTQLFENEAGCDSLVYLILTINHPALPEVETIFTCDSFTWHDSTYYETGLYTFERPGYNGECDTTEALYLTINHASEPTEFDTNACESFTWNGITYTESGDYEQTFENATGCDSVVTLHLTIHYASDPTEFEITATDMYNWNGQIYTSSGDYTQTLYNIYGCDSVVTLHLTIIHDSGITEFYATACETYTWNDSTYTTSGDYTQTFPNMEDGDSTVVLHLTIHYNAISEITESACESYTWNDSTYTESGDYVQTFETMFGCDSIVTLHLTIHQPTHYEYTESSCGSYTWEWNGETYDESNDYTVTFTNEFGCPSSATLHLVIWPLPDVEILSAYDSVYLGSSLTLTGSGAETYVWSTGETTTEIEIAPQTTTSYSVTGTDEHGCTNSASINITVYGVGIDDYDSQFNVYPNPATTSVNVTGHDMESINLYDQVGRLLDVIHPDNSTFVTVPLDQYTTGHYVLHIKLSDGKVIHKKIILQRR